MVLMNISDLEAIVDRFYAEAQDDIVGLWEIVHEIEERFDTNEEVREQAILLIRLLLARGLVAGNPPYSVTGYEPWPDQEADSVISRVEREWDALGQMPSIGDIVWFGLPAKPLV